MREEYTAADTVGVQASPKIRLYDVIVLPPPVKNQYEILLVCHLRVTKY
jgi:hypothetical protein